ncbi:hypothetical protein [Halobacillus sp. H74]|uniref:hypothetical protein n=1 Tax=Halobacillus sp. H74 TaxID=3457436 RepID=UPI003FCE8138
MPYRVIRAFRDKENGHHTYKKDDIFPVSGEESQERIDYLLSPHNKLKEPLIEKLNEAPSTPKANSGEEEPQGDAPENESEGEEEKIEEGSDDGEGESDGQTESEFPIHTGGPWYELSNGEKIQGKEEAVQAEEDLK